MTLIFNSAFPPPPANVGFPIESSAPRASEDWEIVGMTEAEVESRCLPFDESAMAAFRQGRPVVWVWDPLAGLSIGRQEQSRLANAMRDALAARTQKALTLITTMRDRHELRRLNKNRDDTLTDFEVAYLKNVIDKTPVDDFKYENPRILFFDVKGNHFKEIYGLSPVAFAQNLKEEKPFLEDFYGKKQNCVQYDDYEFFILNVLHRGYRRAIALEKAQRGNRKNIKDFGKFETDKIRSLIGEIESFELTTFEYFLIALHSGFNPQQLHPGLARCHRHLGVAAWLGRLGHRDRLLLPHELCLPMLELLEDDAPFLCDGAEEIANICDLVRRHAELFAGVDRLSAIAEQTLSTGKESVVQRRVYGRITSVRRKGQGRTRNSRERASDGITGELRKGNFLEFKSGPITSELLTRALQMSRLAERAVTLGINGKEVVVRPFLPLAW